MKQLFSQNNFNAGELSPEMYARAEFNKYENGLETATNCLIKPHGPIHRRPGSKLVNEVKDSTKNVRLVPFQFSEDDSYILEFGNQYVRFFTNSARVDIHTPLLGGDFNWATDESYAEHDEDLVYWDYFDPVAASGGLFMAQEGSGSHGYAGLVTPENYPFPQLTYYPSVQTDVLEQAITVNLAPATITVQLTVLEYITPPGMGSLDISSVEYGVSQTSGNQDIATGTIANGTVNGTFQFTASTAGTYYINLRCDTSSPSPFAFAITLIDDISISSNGALEVTTPYSSTEVQALTWAQYGNSIYLAHPDYEPRVLTRYSASEWELTTLSATPPPTVEDGYAPSATLTPFATTGLDITFMAGATSVVNSSFQWTASGSGTNEYYLEVSGGGDPSISTPVAVVENGSNMTEGTVGSLTAGQYDYGDNDTLGYSTIYVRLTDNTDPDSKTDGYINYSTSSVFLDAYAGRQLLNEALNELGRASVTSVTNGAVVVADIVQDFTDTNAIASGDWRLDLSPIAELTPDGTKVGSIINITADDVGTTSAIDTFNSSDVGRYILINDGVVQITAVNSASDIDGQVLKSLSATDETAIWSLENPAWSSARGYPAAVTLFDQRLWFGGTTTQPQTVWGSEVGIFDGFGIGSLDADSVSFDISSSQIDEIKWMTANRQLVIGTIGGEHTISGVSGGAITPSSVEIKPRTYYGNDTQQPVLIGNEVAYIQRSKRKVRTFRYDFNTDGYVGEEITLLAEHITSGGIREMAYAQEPDSVIYAVLDNGKMIVGTYRRDLDVIGWSTWETDGLYEQVMTIKEGEVDQVWVVVNRTIEGATKRYIEVFDTTAVTSNLAGFTDSYLTYSAPITVTGVSKANPGVVTAANHGFEDGDFVRFFNVGGMTELNGKTFLVDDATTNTFTLDTTESADVDTTGYTTYTSGGEVHKLVTSVANLTHLVGETVTIKVDGASHPTAVVQPGGTLALTSRAYEVVVGLPYTTTIKTLRKDFNIGSGTMYGQRVRHIKPILAIYESTFPLLNGEFLPSRADGDYMDEKVPLFSGLLNYGPLGWSNTGQLTVSVSEPYPLKLQGIFGSLEGGIT